MRLQELDGAGAYVLLVRVERPARLAIRSLGEPTLAPGLYAYCGSANGPGGLRARLDRHLRRDKRLHWHIDHLTAAGRIVAVGVAQGGNECDLVRRIGRQGGATPPLPGFGSSDCRRCTSHLTAVSADIDLGRCGLRCLDMAAAS